MSEVIEKVSIRITINGQSYRRKVEPRLLLVQFIREELGLTGTHVGCDVTYCGACTVLVDDKPTKSCTLLAVQADGCEILTVEGLEQDGELHPLQKAFSENHGLQCGYCTPGMLMSSMALLAEKPDPSPAEIRKGISGNLCRCTGYNNIIKSIQAAAREMAG
ncbi:MAG TPA: (2Fe-2S)-binding protein [Gammaproteobacteria bacterium]|jgi:carbon-monoxide dehydrogenase small subunit|nr:carbon monoxide dehydrogenase [Chromatiales bacterium]MCP4926177.1 (2Fe-2S)-binding protein [Gammaproteobacteria bacterium]MDP7152898.1 (2Fe-2S)-binding protein [Gammaproteobacteria bacterium]MDP7296617.1 (2Fe-2S)-binding protein [Gammaproteobacteria bacterium]MDP7661330.1 (2Fe-2S)-binding protein [Gammaproteobacteria bacterium]